MDGPLLRGRCVSIEGNVDDECHYHLYFVPLLYLFYFTFNAAWVYFLIFMYKLEKRDEKVRRVMKIGFAVSDKICSKEFTDSKM